MEYVTPPNVTNKTTAGNGVFYESAQIVTSYNNKGILGSGVFCWVLPEAVSQGLTGQESQSNA
jgi:hypothetical protein